MLGVTCQTVSRWENASCYPDMELLPEIAELLEITVDELLGIDKSIQQKDIESYLNRFQEAVSKGQVEECITIARESVKLYPNNYALLNKLMYALFISGDGDGNIPNWKENMERHDAEIVALGERIIEYCPDQEIRLEATARLAFQHCEMGRKSIGRKIYDTLPLMESCRELNEVWGLEAEELLPHSRKLVERGYEILRNGLHRLAKRQFSDEDRLFIYQKLAALERFIYDDENPVDFFQNAYLHYETARVLFKMDRISDGFAELEHMADYAKAHDNRDDVIEVNTLLLGKQTFYKTEFDAYRNSTEFQKLNWVL